MRKVMHWIEKFLDFLAAVLENIAGLLLTVFTIVIMLQVLTRFVLKLSWPWTEEFARYLFIWMTCIGAAVGVRKALHFTVKMFYEMMPKTIKNILQVIINAFVLAICSLILIRSTEYYELIKTNMSPVIGISMGIPYASVVVFGLFGTIFALHHFLRSFYIMFHSRNNQENLAKEA